MSGMEIALVALVPAVISACADIASEYRAWRKRKRERSEKKENLSLQKSLRGNGQAIQHEYDEDVRRLGSAFERGDAIAREALKDQLISLQTTVISLLRGQQDNPLNLIHPNHASISQQSSSARKSIVTSLAQQYQRLAQAAPIERPVATAAASSSAVATTRRQPNCRGRVVRINWVLIGCQKCEWRCNFSDDKWVTKDGVLLDRQAAWNQLHFQKARPYCSGWRCFLCSDVEFYSSSGRNAWFEKDYGHAETSRKDMLKHLKREHYYDEVRGVIPKSATPAKDVFDKAEDFVKEMGSAFGLR